MQRDALGDRIKQRYESRTQYYLPRRSYHILRLDGKSFHTYTRGADKPFDTKLMNMMDTTMKFLCEEIQGAQFGYTQSDEISILLTDFDKITTDLWFDGNIQKIVSVSSSLATAKFNLCALQLDFSKNLAFFDSRIFTVADPIEVANYFIWRQQDAVRNSIQGAAQSVYSQKQLHEKNTDEQQEMLFQKGINWNSYPIGFKRGRTVVYDAERHQWRIVLGPPTFTQDKTYLEKLIPVHPDFQRVEIGKVN
jgi:tRNA(His) guanylyltransferase